MALFHHLQRQVVVLSSSERAEARDGTLSLSSSAKAGGGNSSSARAQACVIALFHYRQRQVVVILRLHEQRHVIALFHHPQRQVVVLSSSDRAEARECTLSFLSSAKAGGGNSFVCTRAKARDSTLSSSAKAGGSTFFV